MPNVLSGPISTYSAGAWAVLCNAWNAYGLTYGQDYTQSVTFNPQNPNEGVTAEWMFPQRSSPNLVVLSYPSLEFGPNPWDAGLPGIGSGLPIKVSDIQSLVFNYDVAIAGQTGGFNVAYDLWLSSTPDGGPDVTHEIMVWVHTGDGGPPGQVVSNYSDDMFTGSLHVMQMTDPSGSIPHPWQYVAFDSSTDDLKGQIDFAAILRSLKASGIIQGTEYLINVDLGAEITYGSGSLTINYLDVNLNGAGAHLQKEDDDLRGTIRNDELYLYGQSAPSADTAHFTTLQASTFTSTVSITVNGTIQGGVATAGHFIANGQNIGAFVLHPIASAWVDQFGVTWSVPETFTFNVEGLGKLDELRMVFDGPSNVGGPEPMTTFVMAASIDGQALTSAQYFTETGGVEQQSADRYSIVQWAGGSTVFDTAPWNAGLAARTTGSAAHPVIVDAGAGTDVLHVLGVASQYQLTALADGSTLLSEASGLGQNAILKGVETLMFQDGSTLAVGGAGGGGGPIVGGSGPDQLTGTLTRVEIHGRGGNDTIVGVGANGLITGDDGNDLVTGGAGVDTINGNSGNDTLQGGGGGDSLSGDKDNDLLLGQAGDDFIWGNVGADTLQGGEGNDQLLGGQGDDLLNGGAGADYLSGDKGADTVTGGAGADLFHFGKGMELDRVTDFNAAEGDRVVLDLGLKYSLKQVGADTVINLQGGDQMVLAGVTLSSLSSGWIFQA